MHPGGLVEQSSVPPVSQGLSGLHGAPWLHAPHTPSSHTKLEAPQTAPFAAVDGPWSTHVVIPRLHCVTPWSHGLVGVHADPEVHV